MKKATRERTVSIICKPFEMITSTPTKEAKETPNSAYPDLEMRLETIMQRLCDIREPKTCARNEYDPKEVEYFGILSLKDARAPRRKLWYMYYAKTHELDETIHRIQRKYGQKNMYELYRKPIYSGAGLRSRVKNHFSGLKWYVNGNVLEAPPDCCYNDEKVVNTVADLYQAERRRYYDYLDGKMNYYRELDTYMTTFFRLRDQIIGTKNEYDREYFGVLSLTDVRAPQRKVWYMYYVTTDHLDDTIERIHHKYGQKNTNELFRKPVYSGASMRSRVKSHFSALKWYVKGNILEAPPDSCYSDGKVVKAIADLYHAEKHKYKNYLSERNDLYKKRTYCPYLEV